jgi:hypothetical protein
MGKNGSKKVETKGGIIEKSNTVIDYNNSVIYISRYQMKL